MKYANRVTSMIDHENQVTMMARKKGGPANTTATRWRHLSKLILPLFFANDYRNNRADASSNGPAYP